MSNYKMIITSTSCKETAESIQKNLVKERISPCVQLVNGVSSMYQWNNDIINDQEFLLFIKTTIKNIEKAKRVIVDMHNYDNPEIISIDFDVLTKEYASWFNTYINGTK